MAQIDGGNVVKIATAQANGQRVNLTDDAFAPSGGGVFYPSEVTLGMTDLWFWKNSNRWVGGGGGDWLMNSNWDSGIVPGGIADAFIDTPAVVTIGSGSVASASSLTLGGANGLSVVRLDGAVLDLAQGLQLFDGGVLSGDGTLSAGEGLLDVPAGAELRAGGDDRLLIQSGAVSNAGRIEATGTFGGAEIEFTGAVQNLAGSGSIVGRNAAMRFPGGVTNAGAMSFWWRGE